MNKIVLCGCHELGIEIINHLIEKNIQISHIVSLTKKQAEKYKVSGYASYKNLSKKYGIPIYYPKTFSLKDEADLEFFQKEKFDLLILGGWQRLIPNEVLTKLKIGGLGLHGSGDFLPKGRGRSPVNWSIIEGKTRFILHLFKISPGVDDGGIISFKQCEINEWDSCRTLYYKFAVMAKRMLEEEIPKIFKQGILEKKQTGKPTFYPKRSPEDGLIDWKKKVNEIHNFVRAITKPYPGAFSYLNGKKIILWKCQPFDKKIKYQTAKNGEIVEKFSSGDFIVKCKDGGLLVTDYEGDIEQNLIFTSNVP